MNVCSQIEHSLYLYLSLLSIYMQSLLRGRFLRNDRMVEDERPRSTAARELGLLRQRHTVSGLRYAIYYSRVNNTGLKLGLDIQSV